MFKLQFKHLLLGSSVVIALCAALFSVTGIATLFAGKYWSVVIAAGALELGKLVAASFLYRYWQQTAKVLKSYLTVGVTALMFITSVGIYGYLSAGYAAVAAAPQQSMNQIAALEAREQTLVTNVAGWRHDNDVIATRRSQAQTTLDNVLAGSTQLNQRSAFANLRQEVADLDKQVTTNNQAITTAQQEHDSLDAARVSLLGDLNTSGKIGQFIYVAKALGVPLDTVVKWFVLILVFVFDPLAISLILAYNSLIKREQEPTVLPPPNIPLDVMAKMSRQNFVLPVVTAIGTDAVTPPKVETPSTDVKPIEEPTPPTPVPPPIPMSTHHFGTTNEFPAIPNR